LRVLIVPHFKRRTCHRAVMSATLSVNFAQLTSAQ
jgi:hypothetical protein